MNRIILSVLLVLAAIAASPVQAAEKRPASMTSSEYLAWACDGFSGTVREAVLYRKDKVPLNIALDTAMFERIKRDKVARSSVVREQVREVFAYVYENDLPANVLAVQVEKQCLEKRRFLRQLTKDIIRSKEQTEKKNSVQAVKLPQ